MIETNKGRAAAVCSAIAVLGVFVGYAATLRLGRSPAGPPRSITAVAETKGAKPERQSDELRQRMAVLEAELTTLRGQVAQRESGHGEVAQVAADPATPEVVTPEELSRQKQEWRDRMAEAAVNYEAEARDPAWARETQAAITQALERLPAVSKGIKSLECRSETCRIEVSNEQQPDFDKQLPLLPIGVSGQLPTVRYDHVTQADGSARTILYLSRHADNEPSPPG